MDLPERRIRRGEDLAARDRRLIRLFIGGISIAAIGGMLCVGVATLTPWRQDIQIRPRPGQPRENAP